MSLINFIVLHFLTFLDLICYGVLFLLSIQSTCLKCYFTQFSKQPSRPGPPTLHALPPVTLRQPYWPPHVPRLFLAQRTSRTSHTYCCLTVRPQMSRHHSSSCFCSYVTSSPRPFLPAPHKCLRVVVRSALTGLFLSPATSPSTRWTMHIARRRCAQQEASPRTDTFYSLCSLL